MDAQPSGPWVRSRTSESAETAEGAQQDKAATVLCQNYQAAARKQDCRSGGSGAVWRGGWREQSEMPRGCPRGQAAHGDALQEEGIRHGLQEWGMGRAVTGVARGSAGWGLWELEARRPRGPPGPQGGQLTAPPLVPCGPEQL